MGGCAYVWELAPATAICHPGPVQSAPPRIAGRKVAVGFLLLVLTIAGTAVGIYLWGREPLGTIRSMAPVDDHRVFLVRDGHRQHGFAHFTFRDLRGGQVWAVPFHDVPQGAVPVAVAGRALLWVQNANVRNELQAFDLETGQFAFRVGETPIVRDSHPTVELVTYQDRAVASIGGPTPRVDVIDVREGRVLASHELPGARERAPSLRVVPSGVEVLPADEILRLVNPLTGTMATLPPVLRSSTATVAQAMIENDGTARIPHEGGFTVVSAQIEERRAARISSVVPRGDGIWVAAGTSVAVLDARTGRVRGSHGPATFSARREPSAPR